MKKNIQKKDQKYSGPKTQSGASAPASLRSRAYLLGFFEGMARNPLSMEILRHSVWRNYAKMAGGS